MARGDTIKPTSQAQARMREEQAKKRAAENRKRAQDKVRNRGKKSKEEKQKEAAAEAARLEKEAKALRARAAVEAKKGSGFSTEYIKGAAEAEAKAVAARKRAGQTATRPATPARATVVGQGPLRPGEARVPDSYVGAKPRGTRARQTAGTPAPTAAPAPGGGAPAADTAASAVSPPSGAPGALPAPGNVENEALALGALPWMLNHPELGNLWRQATANRWHKDIIRAKVLGTGWFREQGTANVVAQLRQLSQKWLVPLGDEALKDYAVKLATKEIQPANIDAYLREQAANAWPGLKQSIGQGISPTTYFEPYRQRAAEVLELNPEQVSLSDPRYRRALDFVDPKTGERRVMTDTEWRETLRTDRSYGWRFTNDANKRVHDAIAYLAQKHGMVA